MMERNNHFNHLPKFSVCLKRRCRFLWIALLLLSWLWVGTSCSGSSNVETVKVKNSSAGSRAKRSRKSKKQAAIVGDNSWVAAKNWQRIKTTRDPFKGYIDTLLAEKRMQESKSQQDKDAAMGPSQRYNIGDYHLLAVITGTADPKAYVTDPSGQRFVLRRGDLIGNRNGTIASIHRDKISIFEMISGEGKYFDIPLHPERTSPIELIIRK